MEKGSALTRKISLGFEQTRLMLGLRHVDLRILSAFLLGAIGFITLPWFAIEEGIFSLEWLQDYPQDKSVAPALFLATKKIAPWLWHLLFFLFAPILVMRKRKNNPLTTPLLLMAGFGGLGFLFLQGFAIGPVGYSFEFLEKFLPPLAENQGQYGFGMGAAFMMVSYFIYATLGLSSLGWMKGDSFLVGSILMVLLGVGLFIFYPVTHIFYQGFLDSNDLFSLQVFTSNLFSESIWKIEGWGKLGVAWNTFALAVSVGAVSTALGLIFALVLTRTNFPFKKIFKSLSVLPIITPPFVIGLAVILLFGRAGTLTTWMYDWFQIEPTRYIFGFSGIFLAQILAFTPIAFLALIGVVEGVSPSMEEASQTLGANPWQTFKTVTLPLMKPGIANAFLLGFIESMADFGNPMVLGGNYEVLATEIYFAVAGAELNYPRAAALAMVLMAFTLGAFLIQQKWIGKKSYTTVTGKGDSGMATHLPKPVKALCYGISLPWLAFTASVYAMIIFGGFVKLWGRDHSFTLKHYTELFSFKSIEWSGVLPNIHFTGAAWDSLWNTLKIATVSAPLTAAAGLIIAYLLVRQKFQFHKTFEFGTMLSFAIPGTVIGVSYILAFNTPPFEFTGTVAIIVLCFIFRNMPVGIRSGMAALSQLDKSLDEGSITLGASSFKTLKSIVLPLIKPAILASLVYSFVRAMTAISAVIFLVSADTELATTYVLGRVENGDYGPSIAYCSVLILIMMIIIGLMQFLVGKTQIRRR